MSEEKVVTDIITLTRHVLDEQRKHKDATGDLTLVGLAGGAYNISGDEQKKLDVISNEIFVNALRSSGKVAVMVSEENDEAIIVEEGLKGKYCVVFDPLDGSSNIDAGVNIGSPGTVKDVLRPGNEMIVAGYCMYGSSANMVISVGNGVNGYTLDDGNAKYWHEACEEYFHSLKFPPEGKNPYSARYIGSMVADVHRTFLYGGIFAYPADKKSKSGKLRLLYECFPMAFLAEQAGGKAITGHGRVLDVCPEAIHSRCPIFLGSKDDVEDVERIYKKYSK
ncbi:3653_t:CDS:2 [Racocetra fulgida]|uniref:Fructose-1,6-bisphosphatase n=1 Tax=Racocetra fulgida TaxID=60492 RepID=A0A9N8Z7H0_9GLOM|nr:3653_t:CDS:2 [Racocetra fulgida]